MAGVSAAGLELFGVSLLLLFRWLRRLLPRRRMDDRMSNRPLADRANGLGEAGSEDCGDIIVGPVRLRRKIG